MKVTIDHSPMQDDEANESDECEEYEEYEIQSAADCLIRAEEIKKNPELYPLAMKEIEKKKVAINAVKPITSMKDLKAVASKKIAEYDPEEND